MKNGHLFMTEMMINEFLVFVAVTFDLIWRKRNEILHNTNINC